jgi:hypothetical protein
MKEKIRELAEQVSPVAKIGNWGRVEWSDNVFPQLGDTMYASIDLEKVAELILDECCLKLLDMDKKTNGNHNYYKHAALQLKRHFRGDSTL